MIWSGEAPAHRATAERGLEDTVRLDRWRVGKGLPGRQDSLIRGMEVPVLSTLWWHCGESLQGRLSWGVCGLGGGKGSPR